MKSVFIKIGSIIVTVIFLYRFTSAPDVGSKLVCFVSFVFFGVFSAYLLFENDIKGRYCHIFTPCSNLTVKRIFSFLFLSLCSYLIIFFMWYATVTGNNPLMHLWFSKYAFFLVAILITFGALYFTYKVVQFFFSKKKGSLHK